MSLAPFFARLDERRAELHEVAIAGLEQCRRRGRAELRLIDGDGGAFTDPDWVQSVPGSGHGGLGSRNPFDTGGGGFDDQHPLNPRGEGD